MGQTTLKRFKAKEIIFNAGDEGDCAYIIDSGRVQIFIEKLGLEIPVNVLGVGEIFGEMAILDRSPRSASARALNEVQVSVVSRTQFEQRIEQADPIVKLLVSILLKRLRSNLGGGINAIAGQSSILVGGEGGSLEAKQNGDAQEGDHPDVKESHNQVIEKIKFEAELHEALKNDHFLLYYQPIVDLHTGRVAGFESLIRWKSDTRGMVRPDLFIGVAEETSLIVPIGKWVLRESFKALAAFNESLTKAGVSESKKADSLFMTINISGKQFLDPQFFSDVLALPEEFAINPKRVKMEITEKIFLSGNLSFFWLEKLRSMGFPISLDDFGTGYSMLSYLSQFNFDSLKIDQSFIRKIHTDDKTRIVVSAIVGLAKGLNIEIIAEGVEYQEQVDILKEMGCHLVQGYFYGKPMPFTEALSLINK